MSEVVKIPGGEATLINSPGELSPRRRRPIEILSSRIGRKLEAIQNASRLLCEGDVVIDQSDETLEDGSPKFTGGDVEVSERELGLVMRLNDTIAFSLLKSWTIPHRFPESADEFLDCPPDVFDALREHAARINAELQSRGDGFTVDSVEDKGSPTGG
jgi:hypothetical protein